MVGHVFTEHWNSPNRNISDFSLINDLEGQIPDPETPHCLARICKNLSWRKVTWFNIVYKVIQSHYPLSKQHRIGELKNLDKIINDLAFIKSCLNNRKHFILALLHVFKKIKQLHGFIVEECVIAVFWRCNTVYTYDNWISDKWNGET